MKNPIDRTVYRFAIVGIVNTAVGAGIMFLLYNCLGVSYWISSASNYIVGSIVSYFLNKHYTFQSKSKSMGEVVRFVINISVCYFLAYGIAKPAIYYLLRNESEVIKGNVALIVGMVLFVGLNYFGQRIIVFKYDENKTNQEKVN